MTELPDKPAVPYVRDLDLGVIGRALAAGWTDFRHEPMVGGLVSLIFVAGGWLMAWQLNAPGQHWWVFVLALGFPLIGPFAAVAYYEISRRRETGEAMSLAGVLSVVVKQRHRQVPSMAMVMILIFLFWIFIAHMIFGLFLGLSAMTNVSTSYAILLTPNGLAMLALGSAVGAALSLVIFNNAVVGLPIVVDREVDIITAIIASWQTVFANPVVMLTWALVIVVLVFLAMLPGFLGLLVVLPWLGHATWHMYRAAIAYEDD